MKFKSILCSLLLAWSVLAEAIEINRYVSGTWVNFNQLGHGFNVQVLPGGITVVYWYVYHPDGTPTFLIGVGTNDGNVTSGTVYYNSGMKFGEFDPATRTEVEWGSFSLSFESCDTAVFEYVSMMQHEGVPYGSGSIPISRFIGIESLPCSENQFAGLYRGVFRSTGVYPIFLDDLPMSFPGLAILAPDGNFLLLAEKAWLGVGTWQVQDYSDVDRALVGTGTALTLNIDVFGSGGVFDFNGPISAEHGALGTYWHQFGDYGDFDLYANPHLYHQGVSLQALAGQFLLLDLDDGVGGTATIGNDGGFSAATESGCKLSGQATVPDEAFNLFMVELSLTGCSGRDEQYTGYGFRDELPYWSGQYELVILAHDTERPLVLKLTSQ